MRRVIVVGGGIGGLATGVALERVGINALVLERADELREVGAGFNLGANAVKAIRHLGCAPLLEARGTESEGVLIGSLQTGEPIVFAREEIHYQIHRADLLDGLREALSPTALRLGCRVTGFRQDAHAVVVELDNGDEVVGDVLVGADGIRSEIREALIGPQDPHFTGCIAWRAVFPAERLPHYAVPRNWGWAGPGRSAFFYPVRRYELLNFVANVPAREVTRESWTLSGEVADLQRSLEGSCDQVLEIVAAIDEAFLTGIYFHDPLPSWGEGRATLLGDAAHAAGPFVGQGGAMAIEDAITLAACLSRAPEDNPAAGLREYERRRQPRTARFQIAVRQQQQFLHESDPERIRARNLRACGAQRLDPLWGGGVGFLIGFDPVAALDRPIDELERLTGVAHNTLRRPEARRAFDLWAGALSAEDRAGDWIGERAAYEAFLTRESPPGPDVRVHEEVVGDIPAHRVSNNVGANDGPIAMHLHGGGYVLGSGRAAAGLAGRIAAALVGEVVCVDYRLAPEHGCPAALEDALAAWSALANRHPHRRLLVTGEDAGGGLAVALALALRDRGDRLPDALYLLSPFCDLSLTSPSIDASAGDDPWLTRDTLVVRAGSYVQALDPAAPEVSPLHAELEDLPPMLIHAAADEALADDARRLAERIQAAGGEVCLRLFADTVHSFALFDFLPETAEAMAELGQFWATHVAPEHSMAGGER